MNQHTPTTWKVQDAGNDLFAIDYFTPGKCEDGIDEIGYRPLPNTPQNRSLIAAAPELLALLDEGCRLAVTDYGQIGEERACNADYLAKVNRSNWWSRARAAITKATGEGESRP